MIFDGLYTAASEVSRTPRSDTRLVVTRTLALTGAAPVADNVPFVINVVPLSTLDATRRSTNTSTPVAGRRSGRLQRNWLVVRRPHAPPDGKVDEMYVVSGG